MKVEWFLFSLEIGAIIAVLIALTSMCVAVCIREYWTAHLTFVQGVRKTAREIANDAVEVAEQVYGKRTEGGVH